MTDGGDSKDSGPVGIGGWLILAIVGLAVVLALGLSQLVLLATRLDLLISMYASADHDLGARLIWSWAWTLTIYLLVPLLVGWFLLRKSRLFPRAYIAWMLLFAGTTLFYAARDGFITSIIPVVWVLLWTPYLLMSTRVKNTFVN
jgi:hypothetical protein